MNGKTLNLILYLVIGGIVVYLLSQFKDIFTSGTTANNVATNALTGQLTQSQQEGLVAAETKQLIQAGQSPSQAAAQASSDVSTAVSTGTVSYGTALWDVIKNPTGALAEIF